LRFSQLSSLSSIICTLQIFIEANTEVINELQDIVKVLFS